MKVDKAEIRKALQSPKPRRYGLRVLAAVVLFGIGQGDTGAGPVARAGLTGAVRQGREGFATPASTGARLFCGFSLPDVFGSDLSVRAPHWLGSTFGLVWTVPPGAVQLKAT